eukprot:5718838-Prorocentrum_lima.AAC.1
MCRSFDLVLGRTPYLDGPRTWMDPPAEQLLCRLLVADNPPRPRSDPEPSLGWRADHHEGREGARRAEG